VLSATSTVILKNSPIENKTVAVVAYLLSRREEYMCVQSYHLNGSIEFEFFVALVVVWRPTVAPTYNHSLLK